MLSDALKRLKVDVPVDVVRELPGQVVRGLIGDSSMGLKSNNSCVTVLAKGLNRQSGIQKNRAVP